MKTLFITALMISNFAAISPSYADDSSGGGRPLPIQASADVIKAVTNKVLADNGFRFLSISKISVSANGAKVQLLNADGECLAIPYIVKYNSLGEVEVEVNTAAMAICN